MDKRLLNIRLDSTISRLRDEALRFHRSGGQPVVSVMPLIDAEAWADHTDDEDWLVWRARRVAARLNKMPISISRGEMVVGRPDYRPLNENERERMEKAREILRSIPPFPGGDAGHFHPDFAKLFAIGIRGIRNEIDMRSRQNDDPEKVAFYRACRIAIDGLASYAVRVAEECEKLAGDSESSEAARLEELARICRKVSSEPPSTFHEAIQLMFLTIIALWFGEDHHLTTPGRMDQTLLPFYLHDLETGAITWRKALDLVACLYIQLNMILAPGSAVSVMVGGRDRSGRNVTNDLTYICLLARAATKLVYPTVGLAWHENTPPELMDFACRMIRTGIGDPAIFNDELIVNGLRDLGVSEPDSYDYMNSTCVEIKPVGCSNIWVTQPYFNCPRALLEVMEQVSSGDIPEPATFDILCKHVKDRLAQTVSNAAKALDAVWHRREQTGCFPLASCLINDCLERGLDFDRGGARYNWVENSFVGLANLADSLMAIKKLVYESGELSIAEYNEVIKSNFEGAEPLRQKIIHTIPSYGNDNDEVDTIAADLAEFLAETTASNHVGLSPYVPGFFCWIIHERFGSETGATPDGRRAGFPLADGAGAAQGREKAGPTASVLSTTKWSHREAIGGLVHNVKFSQETLKRDSGLVALRNLIETYMRRGGFEIQVNVVSADQLRDAQKHPEQYADLLVRVAGYSDYFVHLNRNMQEEVIARTEHTL